MRSQCRTAAVCGQLVVRAIDAISGGGASTLNPRSPDGALPAHQSSRPSLGFFVLLISSAVIATLGLISNSTAVVIGAMPFPWDPILSFFGLAVSDAALIKRSAITVLFGTCVVIASAAVMSWALGISHVQSEITGRISPNLIDLGIAVAASIAGSFTMTRERLSNSIAGVAIAVALVPPLCVCGIGLTLGNEVIAVFGRGSVAGLSNQIAEGSFLLYVANLIGITVAGLLVFLLQQYGSIAVLEEFLIWFAFFGVLSIPLSSALHDFSLRQELNAEFGRFKAGQVKEFKLVQRNPYLWSKVRIMYSNVQVKNNEASFDLVINAPEELMKQSVLDEIYQQLLRRSNDLGLAEIDLNISVIPNRVFRFDTGNASSAKL